LSHRHPGTGDDDGWARASSAHSVGDVEIADDAFTTGAELDALYADLTVWCRLGLMARKPVGSRVSRS
jgi:hypothetical protein